MKAEASYASRFRRYQEYRASAIAWLGDVPLGWVDAPVYSRYEVALGKMLNERAITGNHLAPYLRNTDVQWDRVCTEDLPEMDFPAHQRERYGLRHGDLLVCEGGEIGRTAVWRGELPECYYQKAIHRVRPKSAADDPRFFYYLMVNAVESGVFRAGANLNTIDHLTAVKLKRHRFPFPPIDQQRAIAAFLDARTTEIDTLTAKKERLIELLEEKRAALITQTVTKGLNAKVPMKESGAPWVGQIPEHWRYARISYVAGVFNGSTPSRDRLDYWEQGDVPWLSSGKVNDGTVTEADEFVTRKALLECSIRVMPVGSVLVGMIGQGKTRGMSAFMEIPACINQNVAAVVPRPGISGRFLHLVFKAAYLPLREFGRGGQQEALNCDLIKAFRVPLPPEPEQERIAAFLVDKAAQIDGLTSSVRLAIDRLREYRTALISAAVTGKIDVSSYQDTPCQ